ncbi:MAG: Sulfate transport system permease protein CysW [Pseudomonadota bacterium]|jgi:iron(III) transport system permease protein
MLNLATSSHPSSAASTLWLLLLALAGVVMVVPMGFILSAWLDASDTTQMMLQAMAHTVLPQYVATTAWLCLGVSLGAGSMGLVSATLVTLYEFPGKRQLEWLLLLPMAMPSFIVGFAYTDFFQFSGSLQSHVRQWLGWQGALWPDIRSLWGAVLVFSLTLYPYVYVLVRAALLERASHLMVSARLLGASSVRRWMTIAWPMSRPAWVAGLSLVLMETLADYGLSSYFGIQTFSTGVFKAWLVMDQPALAAQLSSMLLLGVFVVLLLEAKARQHMRFHARGGGHDGQAHQAMPLRGTSGLVATLLTSLPVVLGFGLPCAILISAMLKEPIALQMANIWQWTFNGFYLAALTAVLAVAVALLFTTAKRLHPHAVTRLGAHLIGLGYALPGTILVVGVLGTLSGLDRLVGLGWSSALIASGGALMWTYLIRFSAVAMQSIESGYSRIPQALDEASKTLGQPAGATFVRVHVPLLKTSLLTGLLLVFVDVMKELPATLVLRPFDHDTLAVVAYQLARDERLGEAALPALLLVAVGLIPVLLLIRSMRKTPDK